MISVITCTRKPPEDDINLRNISKTIEHPFEYIRIDNQTNSYSLSSAYNKGIQFAKGDILVFVHDDVFFMEPNWGDVLASKFKDPQIGIVGVAGTQYLLNHPSLWVTPGRPFIRGHVVHEIEKESRYEMSLFSLEKSDSDVVAVDGLFMAFRADVFKEIAFDERTFDNFHFYDLDICMQARKSHKIIVTWDILIKHLSAGKLDHTWKYYAEKFVEKYRSTLPASCTTTTPDLSNRIGPDTIDLRGKAPQITIC